MEEQVIILLTKFLIISIIFESAMTTIFNWRIFIKYFDGKGLKVPLTFIVALIISINYDLDILRGLLNILNNTTDTKSLFMGKLITSLLIAGGSHAFYQILVNFGVRDPLAREKKKIEINQEVSK